MAIVFLTNRFLENAWCIYCDGCMHRLVGSECLAKWFKDRDAIKWVLQKWEKEGHAETISHAQTTLHPTPFVNVGGSKAFVASCAEVSSTPLGPVPLVPFGPQLLS